MLQRASASSPEALEVSAKTAEYRRYYAGENGLTQFIIAGYEALQYKPPTRVHRAMARTIQHGPNRQYIGAPRSTGKSTLMRFAEAWHCLQNPQVKIVNLSKADDFAKKCNETILSIVKNFEPVKHLAPAGRLRKAAKSFDLSEALPGRIQTSVASQGISGQVTGMKGNFINPDDIETIENVRTEIERSRVRGITGEIRNLVIPNEPYWIIYTGTPHHEESVYWTLIPKGYKPWIWPLCYPSEELLAEYGKNGEYLAPEILRDIQANPSLMKGGVDPRVGQITDPEWFSVQEVEERLQEGWPNFLMQSMMIPTLGDRDLYAVQLSDLIVTETKPELGPCEVKWSGAEEQKVTTLECRGFSGDAYYGPSFLGEEVPFTTTILVPDPSSSGKDDFAYSVLSGLNGNIFLHESGVLPYGSHEAGLVFLAEKCLQWRVKNVYDDRQFAAGTWPAHFGPVLQRVCADDEACSRWGLKAPWQCGIDPEGYKRFTNKEATIAALLGWAFGNHRLIVNPAVLKNDIPPKRRGEGTEVARQRTLVYQLSRLQPRKDCLPFDDRVDSLAMGVYFFRSLMAQDDAVMAQRRRSDLVLEQLKAHAKAREEDPYRNPHSLRRGWLDYVIPGTDAFQSMKRR